MEILKIELSPKTEFLAFQIINGFSKPVKFFSTTQLNNSESFGAIDYSHDGAFHVYLREDLPQNVFEANLLHELHHGTQYENGFPCISSKINEEYLKNKDFFEDLGSKLGSCILDIDVNNWLLSNGYAIDYFINKRYQTMVELASYNYPHWQERYNFAQLVISYFLTTFHLDQDQIKNIKSLYKHQSELLTVTFELSDKVRTIGCNTPNNAVICLCEIMDSLNLWGQYLIAYRGQKIRTSSEAKSLIPAYK